jgi:predicted RNase H-like nuclease (RuvC/YqgF family)
VESRRGTVRVLKRTTDREDYVGRRGRGDADRPGRREGGQERQRDRSGGGADRGGGRLEERGEHLQEYREHLQEYKERLDARLDRMDERLDRLEQQLQKHLEDGGA